MNIQDAQKKYAELIAARGTGEAMVYDKVRVTGDAERGYSVEVRPHDDHTTWRKVAE